MKKNDNSPILTANIETLLEARNPTRPTPGPTRCPLNDTYEHVSILLGYCKHLVRGGDMKDDHEMLGQRITCWPWPKP